MNQPVKVYFAGGPWDGKSGKLLLNVAVEGTSWLRFNLNGYISRGRYVKARNTFKPPWQMVWQEFTNTPTPN